MTEPARPYRAVLFDLFRTLIVYDEEAPTGKVHEPQWRSAMGALRPRAEELLPGVAFERFLDALVEASDEIARARAPEHREVPIAERYRRAVVRLVPEPRRPDPIAEELASLQLEAQSAHARLPQAHRDVVERLAPRYALAIVSNFDHGPTVRRLLARVGLDRICRAVAISDEIGRRKPHPEIFRAALRALDVRPEEALFVGDSLTDDVGGARALGIDAVWLNRKGREAPSAGPTPTLVIGELDELLGLLGA